MIKIKVITPNNRGFLINLFTYGFKEIEFDYSSESIYETPSNMRSFLSKMIKMSLFDWLGIFQIYRNQNVNEDMCFSYNRLVDTNKPYVILLENPSALVNYCWDRPKHLIAKTRLKRRFNDETLRSIVCMSKECKKNIYNLYDIPERLNIEQVYPLIPDDYSYGIDDIKKIAYSNTIECLYISSDFELKGGRDIIRICELIENSIPNVRFTAITKMDTIREEDARKIDSLNNLSIVEFSLNKNELNEIYKRTSIFVYPTRADSFSLVTLEAMKYGCVIFATDIYAIKEMVINDHNGYLFEPLYKTWDSDGTLNKYYRTHQKQTFYSGKTNDSFITLAVEKLRELCLDREKLFQMACNSLSLSRNDSFSEKSIVEKWKSIIEKANCDTNKP